VKNKTTHRLLGLYLALLGASQHCIRHAKGMIRIMKQIDLHVHSNASDGTLSPSELVHYAIEKELAAIALTDHDTVLGIKEAMETATTFRNKGIDFSLIPGVEISAGFRKRDIHILGLFVDYTNAYLLAQLDWAVKNREARNEKMAENLRKAGLSITVEELRQEDPKAILTRAHFAKLLYKKGYVKNVKDAFTKFLDENGPYYVNRDYISPEGAIALIKEAGGIPILAHPLLYHLNEREIDALVGNLTEAGLAGIEAIYANNVSNDEAFARSLARKYNLLISGGSDFHGSIKPDIDLGSGRGNLKVPAELLDAMQEYRIKNLLGSNLVY